MSFDTQPAALTPRDYANVLRHYTFYRRGLRTYGRLALVLIACGFLTYELATTTPAPYRWMGGLPVAFFAYACLSVFVLEPWRKLRSVKRAPYAASPIVFHIDKAGVRSHVVVPDLPVNWDSIEPLAWDDLNDIVDAWGTVLLYRSTSKFTVIPSDGFRDDEDRAAFLAAAVQWMQQTYTIAPGELFRSEKQAEL